MSDCMTQEDAERMDANQAVHILEPLRAMMLDQYGCPISAAYFALGKAIEALEKPTVDAVPVRHSKWIIRENEWGTDEAKCPECGFEMLVNEPGNGLLMVNELLYCPHCGVKMDGADGERRSE